MSENVQTFSGKVNVADNLLVGTSHFFVDRQNNRVGIGTSTPDASSMLDVTGNIKSGGTITATGGFSGDGSGLSGVNSDSGSWVNGSSSNIHLAVSTDKVGIGTVSPAAELHVAGTGAIIVPTGSTGDRPTTGVNGMIRYNSTIGNIEVYTAGVWTPLTQAPTITGISPLSTLASGGQTAGYDVPTEMPQPPNAANGDKLGWSVSLSGNGMYALAGAAYDTTPSRGALHIYVRNASTDAWTHQQELTIPNITSDDYWGYTQHAVSLSNDGTYAVAGAQYHNSSTGRARVWVRNGTSWSHQQELTISSMPTGAYFGSAVDISTDGNYIIIGAYSDDVLRSGAGAAHIFIRSGTTWSHQATLPRTGDGNSGDYFGVTVGISSDGTYAVVGSPYGTPNTGSAHIYIRSGTTWTHQKLMVDPNGQASDAFGHGVHISGDGNYAAIGAQYDASNTGAGHIFIRNGTSWTHQQQITITSAAAGDVAFEQLKLSQDGTVLVVSVQGRSFSGTVYGSLVIFTRSGTNWTQTKEILSSDLPNPVSYDLLGHCSDISSDGTMIVSGAYNRDTGGTDRGAMFSIPFAPEIIDASTQVFTATGTGIVSGSTVQLEGADGTLYSVFDVTLNAAGTQVTFKMSDIMSPSEYDAVNTHSYSIYFEPNYNSGSGRFMYNSSGNSTGTFSNWSTHAPYVALAMAQMGSFGGGTPPNCPATQLWIDKDINGTDTYKIVGIKSGTSGTLGFDVAQQPYKVRILSPSGLNVISTAAIGLLPTWTTAALTDFSFDVGVSGVQTIAGTDGGGLTTNRTFSLLENLPANLGLNPNTGVIQGIPTTPGTTPVVFRLFDTNTSLFVDRTFNIVVNDPWEIIMRTSGKKNQYSSAMYTSFGNPGSNTFRSITASSTGASSRTSFGDAVGLYDAFFTKTGITKIALVSGDGNTSSITSHGQYIIYDLVESSGSESLYDIIKRLDQYNQNNASWAGSNFDNLYQASSVTNFTAGTNGYSGTRSGSSTSGIATEAGQVPDKFCIWGINQDSDNDTQVLCAYSGTLAEVTPDEKGDSWRGGQPKHSFWSYWGNDWHSNSQSQTIGSATQSNPGIGDSVNTYVGDIYLMAF